MPLRPEKFYTKPISKARTMVRSMLRRATVLASASGLWQTEGYDGEQEDATEVFGVGGIYSRPESSDAEAIVAKIGGGSNGGVIVATRDETARQAVDKAKNLAAGETVVFAQNGSYVHLAADGTVTIHCSAGEIKLGESASESVIKGDSYTAAESTVMTAIGAYATAAGPTPDAITLNAAITAFLAGNHLSSKTKTE